jgi:tetratricopeptide (TPR) repeat protein
MRGFLIGLFLILFMFPAASQSKKDTSNKDNIISQETLDLLSVDYLSRGNAAYNKGLFDQAIADYTKALMQVLPNAAAGIYTNRGSAYFRIGRYDMAIADETKAIALAPGVSDAYNMRAWIHHLKGENAKALPDANKALELAPADARNLETRAEIYEKLGRREKAIADYRAALKQDPDDKDSQAGLKRLVGVP